MAKRSRNVGHSEWLDEEEQEEEIYDIEIELESSTSQIMLLKNLNVNYYGKATGNLYSFSGGGAIIEVDNQDVPDMLAKNGGNCTSCPSSIGRTPYFSLVEG